MNNGNKQFLVNPVDCSKEYMIKRDDILAMSDAQFNQYSESIQRWKHQYKDYLKKQETQNLNSDGEVLPPPTNMYKI